MTWSIVGVGSVVETITTTHTLTEPASVSAGDLLVACIASRVASTTAVTMPAGWTLITDQKINNVVAGTTGQASACIAYIVRGASAPALGFTHPATPSVARGQIVAYRENTVGGGISIDTSSTGATATAITAISIASSVTTTFASDLLVGIVAGGSAATYSAFKTANAPSTASGATNTSSTPSTTTWTERADASSTTGADVGLAVFDAVKTATGTGGAITATASVSSGHSVLMAAFQASVPTADAWNVNERSATITLSNSDKTATTASPPGFVGVRSTTRRVNGTAGKYYAEFLCTTMAVNTKVGIINASASLTAQASALHVQVGGSSGAVTINGAVVGNLGGVLVNGDVLCVAWDAGAELVWFRKNGNNWNNNASHDPATSTGGYDGSIQASGDHALWFSSSTNLHSVTLRTELADYTQAVPSGFTSWMGEASGPPATIVALTGAQATGAAGSVTVDATSGGGALWTPQDIAADLGFWLQADTVAGSGTLTTWADDGPDGLDFTTAGTGPTIVAAGLDGKKTLDFVYTPLAAAARQFDDFGVYTVVKGVGTGTGRLIDHNYSTGFWLGWGYPDATEWGGGIKYISDPYGVYVAGDYTEWRISSFGRVSTAGFIRVDGGAVADVTPTVDGSQTSSYPIYIAASDAGGSDAPYSASIAEIVCIDANVTTDSRDRIEGYLAWKWGLEANLPVGHPYKSAAPTTGAPSGDVTVAVTGAQATGQAGTVTATGIRNASTTLTGAEAIGQAGTITVNAIRNASTTLTGAQATASAGTVTASGTRNASTVLTGAQTTGQAGTVSVATATSVSTVLTGGQATATAGSIRVALEGLWDTATWDEDYWTLPAIGDVTVEVIGSQASTAAGTVTITAKQAVSVTLTGVQATAQAGGVAVAAGGAISVGVSGAQATGQAGTVGVTANRTVSTILGGVAATGQVGTVTVNAVRNVSTVAPGAQATGQAGTVGITANRSAAILLTGAQASGQAGGVSILAGGSITIPLTGSQATGQAGSVTVTTTAAAAGLVKVWTGSAWVDKPAKVWTGSAWAQKPVKHWTDSAWV